MESTISESGQLKPFRRVLMLETDERSGLVAELALACHKLGVSLEITTGHNHILLTFTADQKTTDSTVAALINVPGVESVFPYNVLAAA
jgi:hypothetical protein